MDKKIEFVSGAKIFVTVFLLINVVIPLFFLLFNIEVTDFYQIFNHPQFMSMIFNSFFTSFVGSVCSIALAFLLSHCVIRTKIRFKGIITVIVTVPMLIPSISHGTGLVFLLGDNGLITKALGMNIHLYGYTGIILGSILYSFPVAFLMLSDTFKYEDFTTYEAASVLGIPKIKQFFSITVANMKGPLISIFFAVFTMIFSDYGVPLTVGGKEITIPVYMYQEVIGMLDFSKGAILSLLLLLPAIIAFAIDLKRQSSGNMSTVIKPFVVSNNKVRDYISYAICAITIFLISLPIFTFAYLSFVEQFPIDMSFSLVNIFHALELDLGSYLLMSITIALATSLFGVVLIYVTAFITARSKKTFSTTTLHIISLVTLAIPGIVLGLCYVLFFNGSPIYGGITIIVLVNIIHFYASPYLLAYNSLKKYSTSFEDVSSSLGISKFRLLIDVYVPSTKDTIAEMYSYLFVNSMVTISAVSFLASIRVTPIAMLIPQFDSQIFIQITAIISLLILIVNLVVKLSIYALKKTMQQGRI